MQRMQRQRPILGLGILAAFLCVGSAATVGAKPLRCDDRVVKRGASKYEVKARCGEPADVQQHVEYRRVRGWVSKPCPHGQRQQRCGAYVDRVVQVVIDEWTYDFGPRRLTRHLFFERGTLYELKSGGYGIDRSGS